MSGLTTNVCNVTYPAIYIDRTSYIPQKAHVLREVQLYIPRRDWLVRLKSEAEFRKDVNFAAQPGPNLQ